MRISSLSHPCYDSYPYIEEDSVNTWYLASLSSVSNEHSIFPPRLKPEKKVRILSRGDALVRINETCNYQVRKVFRKVRSRDETERSWKIGIESKTVFNSVKKFLSIVAP